VEEMIDTLERLSLTSLSLVIVDSKLCCQRAQAQQQQQHRKNIAGPENSIMCDEPSLLALLCHFYDERAVVILTKKLLP
jgi:hypothetical protein